MRNFHDVAGTTQSDAIISPTRTDGAIDYGLGDAEGAADGGAEADGAADAEADGAVDADADGLAGADADADGLAGADADALADAEALADADGSADALGLAEGVAVRRPPLPSSRALRKIATNTATVAITKTFE